MRSVTDYFSLARPVDFADVDVTHDNRWFVDPFAIRMGLGPTSFAADANRSTLTFFNEVTRCVVSPRVVDQAKGLDLLQHFSGSHMIGQAIWSALRNDVRALVQVGVLKHVEELPIFVRGVGNDITSDLTTRVIFRPLADYTASQVAKHPELAGGTGLTSVRRQVWDPSRLGWTDQLFTLPTVDHQPLILVPEQWVRRSLTLTAGRFYETELLTHVQIRRSSRGPDGTLITTSKERLKEDPRLARGYDTIIKTVEEAYNRDGTDLIKQFKRFAQERYRP